MTVVDLTQMLDDYGYNADQMDGADDWGTFYDDGYGRVGSGTSTPSITYINESGVPDEIVHPRLRGNREIASVIEKWSQELNGHDQQSVDVFRRNKWHGARHIMAQMSLCAWAVENDDILSGLADVTEGLMFQKCRFELFDPDQQGIWNQWAKMVNLDSQLRKIARELFKVSQVYVGLWWENHVFEVEDDPIQATIEEMEARAEEREFEDAKKQRQKLIDTYGNTPGFIAPPEPTEPEKQERRGNRSRRKKFPLTVPTAMTVFDPGKVVPVGTLLFGRERFAYVADRGEEETFGRILGGQIVDDTVLRLIERKYTPTEADKRGLQELGIDPNNLWLLKKDTVFRHCLTKADYERFAPVRLGPVLEILELKSHLRAADRAALVGNTNFIVLITKGSDKMPAKAQEIANLQEQARVIARLPVLVGDHRLHVEIVAPNTDHVLQDSRYQVLDARLVFKALGTFAPISQGGTGSSSAGVSEMSRVVSNGLQNRRHMIVRSIESSIFSEIMDRNEGVRDFDEFPSLTFAPRKIALDFNQDVMNFILKLRDRGDISRETTLEEADFDQDVEVLRRARERVDYDRVFESGVPYSSPDSNPFATGPGLPGPNVPGSTPAGTGVGEGQNGRTTAKPAKKAAKKAPAEGGRPRGTAETQPRQRRS